ncbi:hypothetical protein ABZ619_31995 [Streptomyces sp. NPDC007851]|uniref:hypothetical protein n=1 Tax=Streptomyces sp. NPDC007851 TaxID=3155008 RepID=UPI0033F7674A
MRKKEEGEETVTAVDTAREDRKSWRDVPLGFLAFMLLGYAVLNFVTALFSLVTGFSAEKLMDALLNLGVRVVIALLLLWFFARLRSRKIRKSPEARG